MSLSTRLSVAGLLCALAALATATFAQPESTELPPARPGLQPIALPPLSDLETAVSEQIRDEEQNFRNLTAAGNSSNATLASAYGALGRLFHAYEFFEPAEACYLNAARLSAGDVTWPHLLGYLYQQTGRLEDAAERFEQASRIQPEDRAATVRLGQVYLGLNRLRDASEQFQSVLTAFPALSRQGLGEVALRERRFEEAIEYFRAVLERTPQASSIHYSLAMAYRGLGRLDEARSHLERRGAGVINVGDSIVDDLQTLVRGERGLVVQGRRAYEAAKYQEAADAFTRAIAVAPNSSTARVNLAMAQLQLGNTTAAVTHLQDAFDLAPGDPDVSRELLRVLLRLGRHDEAIAVLAKSRTAKPEDEDLVVGLAILLAQKERFGEALALLDDANRQYPDRISTATTLARLLASSPDRSQRDGTRALDLATRVYEAAPTPAHGETIALALAELERCGEALTWMKQAVEAANQAGDAEESTRLKNEMRKYESVSCRP